MSRPLKTRRAQKLLSAKRPATSTTYVYQGPVRATTHLSSTCWCYSYPPRAWAHHKPAASNANNAKKLFFLITISTLHSESVMLASSLPIQSSRPYRPQYRNDDPYAKFDSGKRKLPRSDQSWDDMAQCFVAQPAGIGQAITKSPRSALAVTFWGEWLKWSIVICWG